MKINITYRPDSETETKQVSIIRAFLGSFLSDAKVRISDKHKPYLHVYITTKLPEKPCKSKERA